MLEKNFAHISQLIHEARKRAFQSVNQELIQLYWKVGEYVSRRLEEGEWGDSTVRELADYLKIHHPTLKAFTARGLYRMKQFYETYNDFEFVSTVSTQISWSANLDILSRTNSPEEREFYIRLAIRERLTVRELRRQISASVFERTMLSDKKLPPSVAKLSDEVLGQFRDTYVFEFLDLPDGHSELELKKAMLAHLKKVILEMGRDFSFVGEEYSVKVGNKDFAIDLLFFHRGLRCLVPVELKIEDFQPEFIGKLNFYLEALDRDVKKEHENPSMGILLCKGKDDEVVEYAMSRNISPAMVADYSTKLIRLYE